MNTTKSDFSASEESGISSIQEETFVHDLSAFENLNFQDVAAKMVQVSSVISSNTALQKIKTINIEE